MEGHPERDGSSPEDFTQQLERTVSDLRTLAETIGAVPAGAEPRVVTRRQLVVTSVVLLILAAAVSWFVWERWHSVFALVAPLVWVVSHSRCWRRGRAPLLTERSARITRGLAAEREQDGANPDTEPTSK
jgi:hypothetical protein